ncbi:hypothetical protein TWF281_003458 [Arthrobotrys megalospora]
MVKGSRRTRGGQGRRKRLGEPAQPQPQPPPAGSGGVPDVENQTEGLVYTPEEPWLYSAQQNRALFRSFTVRDWCLFLGAAGIVAGVLLGLPLRRQYMVPWVLASMGVWAFVVFADGRALHAGVLILCGGLALMIPFLVVTANKIITTATATSPTRSL